MPSKPKAPVRKAASNPHPEANGLAPVDPVRSGSGGLGPERVTELQRARILAAMVQASVQHGAGNVTVAHVVERAGVSRRTFYEIFTDREDCFLAAFDDGIARASRAVLDAYDPNANWVERVRSALVALLTLLDSDPDTGWLLIVGSLGGGARALEHRSRVLAQIIGVIDEGRKQTKNGEGLPPLTAEGILGGVVSVLHARLLAGPGTEDPLLAQRDAPSSIGAGSTVADDRLVPTQGLLGLSGSLMAMIVLPYLGAPAARRELARPIPKRVPGANGATSNPLMDLQMRLTYRTVRVLMAVAANPGSSNRTVAQASGVIDQGQMSKLLARLAQLDLIANTGAGPARGEPNAWTLTDKGWQVQGAIAEQTTGD